MKKEILYPIFLQCASLVQEDTFWRYIYEDLSYGKCPYGLSIYKNYLSCYLKGKEFIYKIDNEKDAQTTYNEVDVLLRQRAGLLSEKEQIVQRTKLYRQRYLGTSNEICPTSTKKDDWSQVKRKMIRDTLIEHYVLKHTKDYSLHFSLTKRVLSIVIVGILLKTITPKDIDYENGFIARIDGIEFYQKKVTLKRNFLHCPLTASDPLVTYSSTLYCPAPKTLQSHWHVYVETLRV